jgi:hypothetical protein
MKLAVSYCYGNQTAHAIIWHTLYYGPGYQGVSTGPVANYPFQTHLRLVDYMFTEHWQ